MDVGVEAAALREALDYISIRLALVGRFRPPAARAVVPRPSRELSSERRRSRAAGLLPAPPVGERQAIVAAPLVFLVGVTVTGLYLELAIVVCRIERHAARAAELLSGTPAPDSSRSGGAS